MKVAAVSVMLVAYSCTSGEIHRETFEDKESCVQTGKVYLQLHNVDYFKCNLVSDVDKESK